MQKVDTKLLEELTNDLFGPERMERVCRDVVAHFADPAQNPQRCSLVRDCRPTTWPM
jgi:hypothetical protein